MLGGFVPIENYGGARGARRRADGAGPRSARQHRAGGAAEFAVVLGLDARRGRRWDAVVSYAGDVYEVEWIDDPGVFHRADFQAVRAPGSSPARGAARPPTHAPASPVWAPDARAAPAASYAMLGFGQPAAPEQNSEQAPPATGSGRAAKQEAARRIREQS